jgi:hypothetical protein
MKIKEATKEQAIAILDAFHNNIVSVCFIKKNGEIRNLIGRQGVKKYLRHRDDSISETRKRPDPSQFTIFYEFAKKDYRMVDVQRLMSIKVSGDVYIIR